MKAIIIRVATLVAIALLLASGNPPGGAAIGGLTFATLVYLARCASSTALRWWQERKEAPG